MYHKENPRVYIPWIFLDKKGGFDLKKKLLCIISILVISASCITGCSFTKTVNAEDVIKSPNTEFCDFEIVDNNYYVLILRDKNTNVLYFQSMSYSGGITPIYNEDGTLKLYEEDEK